MFSSNELELVCVVTLNSIQHTLPECVTLLSPIAHCSGCRELTGYSAREANNANVTTTAIRLLSVRCSGSRGGGGAGSDSRVREEWGWL